MKSLNIFRTGYSESNLHSTMTTLQNHIYSSYCNFFFKKSVHQIVQGLTIMINQGTNRLERSAHPSSNISSTISGSIYSLSAWGDESDDFFLQNIFLKTPIPGCFLGSGMEELFFSAIISTTIQVVSSRSPFDCTAVCKRFQMCKEEHQVRIRLYIEREVGGGCYFNNLFSCRLWRKFT